MRDPSLALLAHAARALGDLREQVVFIGGSIAPLLQTDPPFARARPTTDVDAMASTLGYGDFEALLSALRERGFREDASAPHAHRWLAPGEPRVRLDLVPCGTHHGGSGDPLDVAVADAAVRTEIEPGLVIRHASAPGFLALKLAAFRDRGAGDRYASHDLEDVFALLASRPTILAETAAAAPEIRTFVARAAAVLAGAEELEDLLAGHLANVDRARARQAILAARDRLEAVAALAG